MGEMWGKFVKNLSEDGKLKKTLMKYNREKCKDSLKEMCMRFEGNRRQIWGKF